MEPERELNWGAARTGPSAAGGGGFGRGPAAATAPAARSDGDWGNVRGSGPSAPAPSRAHDADSWGNLRGGGGSSSASKSGKYIPPSQRGGGMSSSPSGFGGGGVRDAGRFAGLGGGGGGGLGSAFGSSRRDDRGSGRLGGMGGGMGGRRDNPAFASAFSSSRRSDSSMGGAGPGKYTLGGVTDPDGPRKMSSHALDKAQSGVRQEAATAAKAGTLTGAGEAEAHIAAQVAKDEEFVLVRALPRCVPLALSRRLPTAPLRPAPWAEGGQSSGLGGQQHRTGYWARRHRIYPWGRRIIGT